MGAALVVAAPAWVPGIQWSDHWAFRRHGIPAAMLTDTAPYRNPNYHRAMDTIETPDVEALARIVHGLRGVVLRLSA